MSLEARITALATTVAAQCNAIDAKIGWAGIQYAFESSTTEADPGSGDLRLNHATPSSATEIYLDAIDAGGVDVRLYIQTWAPGGILRITKASDATVFHLYKVTGVITNVAGIPGNYWHDLTVEHLAGSGSFSASDKLFIAFSPRGTPAVSYQDQKTQNTDGGTFTSGAWQTRTLNTESAVDSIGASLSSNQITLPAGTYLATWSAPAYYVNRHQSRLYNVTDSTVAGIGSSAFAVAGYAAPDSTSSLGTAVFTIDSPKSFRIEHRCQTTEATQGFGVGSNFGTEVYTQITFLKLA
jgi:hypothetical protein